MEGKFLPQSARCRPGAHETVVEDEQAVELAAIWLLDATDALTPAFTSASTRLPPCADGDDEAKYPTSLSARLAVDG